MRNLSTKWTLPVTSETNWKYMNSWSLNCGTYSFLVIKKRRGKKATFNHTITFFQTQILFIFICNLDLSKCFDTIEAFTSGLRHFLDVG